jgi:hypothetical protein
LVACIMHHLYRFIELNCIPELENLFSLVINLFTKVSLS